MDQTKQIVALTERISRVLASRAYSAGLNPAQLEALEYFAAANRFSRTPGAATAYLSATSGTVSQTIIALEKKGLVRRVPHPADRRTTNIEPTQAGRNLLQQHGSGMQLSTLPGSLRDNMEAGLRAVLQNLLKASNGKPFGICNSCKHFQRHHTDGTPHRCGLLNEPLSEADSGLICAEQQPAHT